MGALRRLLALGLGTAYVAAFLTGIGCGSAPPPPEHEAAGTQLFESPQANAVVLSPDGSTLYQALTTMGQVRVSRTSDLAWLELIDVGIDPVSLALRPDGTELWVANHVSDSVSVISLVPGATHHQVIETIQAIDATNLITDFDEPVGIAFANNDKAYVALSSRNQIAVIDADTYTVTDLLAINAQEPRALAVRDGFLYVPAFESGNRSELSSCFGDPNPNDPQCTFDFQKVNFAQNPQLAGTDTDGNPIRADIAADPVVPDRDLYVFDTTSDLQVNVVESIGTLLYGVAVGPAGKVFISQTDARNLVNGRAGTEGKGLDDLDNRMFLNQIGVVSCPGGSCDAPTRFELEPAPPSQPTAGSQLATPYGIALSGDGNVLVVTAAASNRVAALDAATGQVLATADVGNGPRSLALLSDPQGHPLKAYVLNTLDDSVSEISFGGFGNPPGPRTLTETRRRAYDGDATPAAIRNGRIAFNSAAGSTTGTFACASCHPDGHVDQLLWVIGAQCTFEGCDQEEARSTMPVRGLKGTLPLHWDGSLGDPFAGVNGETGSGLGGGGGAQEPANCTDDQSCFRQLVNASLEGVMCDRSAGSCPTTNDVGQPGGLTNAQRDAMATYLQSIQYPPARTRRFDDHVTAQAVSGFSDFFENHQSLQIPTNPNPPLNNPNDAGPETCADNATGNGFNSGCHALPFGASTASLFVGGFEAPTMRGITDRYLQFSAGVSNVRDGLELAAAGGASDVPWSAEVGYDELTVWAVAFGSQAVPGAFRSIYNVGPLDIFQMIEEMSNGQSGALGRQLTLNLRSTTGSALTNTNRVLAVLEAADLNGLVNLRGNGVRNGAPISLSFRSSGDYQGGGLALTRSQLISEAQAGTTTLTVVAQQRAGVNAATVQPTLWVLAAGNVLQNGRPNLPLFTSSNPPLITLQARNIQPGATAVLDGLPAGMDAAISCVSGTLPNCATTAIRVNLANSLILQTAGLHLLQLQNPNGLLTNELPVLRQ